MREPVHLVAQAHELPREEEGARVAVDEHLRPHLQARVGRHARAGVRLDDPERVERRVLVVVEVRVQHEAVLVVVLVVVRVAALALGRRRELGRRLVGDQFAEALDEPPVDGLLDADVVGFGQEPPRRARPDHVRKGAGPEAALRGREPPRARHALDRGVVVEVPVI